MLRGGDEGNAVFVQDFKERIKIPVASREAVDLVNDHNLDELFLDVMDQLLDGGAVKRSSGLTRIFIGFKDSPALGLLTFDIGEAAVALIVERGISLCRGPLIDGYAGINSAINEFVFLLFSVHGVFYPLKAKKGSHFKGAFLSQAAGDFRPTGQDRLQHFSIKRRLSIKTARPDLAHSIFVIRGAKRERARGKAQAVYRFFVWAFLENAFTFFCRSLENLLRSWDHSGSGFLESSVKYVLQAGDILLP
jgi:hypothetical protein